MVENKRQELRAAALRSRDALDTLFHAQASEKIAQHLQKILHARQCHLIHSYISIRSEVNTRDFIERQLQSGVRVIVPITEDREGVTGNLRHVEIQHLRNLMPGKYGIEEPVNATTHTLESVNVILVPIVAFDRTGTRLGYGKGYYDRFLSKFSSALKIGLAFAVQEVPHIPLEEHDIRMNLIVTEREVIECSTSNIS